MRYQLNLEVKLVEVPDPPEIKMPPMPKPGDDPMAAAGAIMTGLMQSPAITVLPFFGVSAGLDFRKSVQLSVTDFVEATKVIRRFHALLEEIPQGGLGDQVGY